MRIRVRRLLRTPKVPPYRETSGIISTWKGITMDAIIPENKRVHAFQLFRTITNAAIEENRRVSIVEVTVTISEFLNTTRKFIFSMAFGKFSSVNPCAPISASGLEVMSAFVLNTLTTTRIRGKINSRKTAISTTIMIAWETVFLRAAFAFASIMLPPPLSCRRKPASHRRSHIPGTESMLLPDRYHSSYM